jgi:hypothetical protein
MTNLSDLLPAGAASKQLSFTASGAISSGQTVGLNSDGTVSVIGEAIGAVTTFTSNRQTYTSAVYDPTNNRVVVFYRDQGDSDKGKAQVGTVSGTSISFGSAVEFEAGQTNYIDAVFDPDSNKIIVSYEDDTNSSYGTAIVGTVSGTSISFGTAVVFSSTNVRETSVTYDTNVDRVAIAFSSFTSYESGFGVAGQVSGTSVTFGTAVRFDTDNTSTAVVGNNMVFDSTNNKVVNIYQGTSNKIQGVVATISGTTISFGTPVDVSSGTSYRQPNAVFDANAGKIVSVFRSGGDGDKVVGVVATVSGTSISFGSVSVLGSIAAPNDGIGLAYSPDSQNSLVTYRQNDSPKSVYQLVATVSGTSVSSSGERVAYSGSQGAEVKNGSLVYDTSSNQFVSCVRENNTDYGLSFVHVAGSSVPSTSFLGIADAAISNAASGNITMKGGVATNASGLLPLATTFGTGVVAKTGTVQAISLAYDADNNKFVSVFRDSNIPYAYVGTVSGTSISFGAASNPAGVTNANFHNNDSLVYDTTNDKFVFVYKDVTAGVIGKAVVGTVSGTSISWGTPVTFASPSGGIDHPTVAFDENAGKCLIAYMDDSTGGNHAKALVGTVSGTSISFGSAVTMNASYTQDYAMAYDANAQKTVVAMMDRGNSYYGKARVATISGTSVSFGTSVTFFSAALTFNTLSAAYDSTAQKVVIMFGPDSPDKDIKGIVGTVSGTDISFGTATEVINNSEFVSFSSVAYNPTIDKVGVIFNSNSKTRFHLGTVSGTSISFGSESIVDGDGAGDGNDIFYDANAQKLVIGYSDGGNSNQGTAAVVSTSTDMTPNTTYYVQNDGTLSTTSSTVTAGKAMSTTSINLDYST